MSKELPTTPPVLPRPQEQHLLYTMHKIRDAAFRDAASLRALADDAINRYNKEK